MNKSQSRSKRITSEINNLLRDKNIHNAYIDFNLPTLLSITGSTLEYVASRHPGENELKLMTDKINQFTYQAEEGEHAWQILCFSSLFSQGIGDFNNIRAFWPETKEEIPNIVKTMLETKDPCFLSLRR